VEVYLSTVQLHPGSRNTAIFELHLTHVARSFLAALSELELLISPLVSF